jgi:hypothetical protein
MQEGVLLDTAVLNRMFKNKVSFLIYTEILENIATKVRRYQIAINIDK